MKKILTWFSSIEKSIFGDKVVSNDYFATITIMIAALSGALMGGGDFLREMDLFDGNVNEFATYALLIGLITLNIGESIMVSKTVGAGFGRSFILLAAIPLAAVIGYIVAVIVFIIIMLYIVLIAISVALGGSSSGSGKKKRGVLSDGTEVVQTGSGFLGDTEWTSTDGTRRFSGQEGSSSVTEK